MSANIFGDDDDNFELTPGGDSSTPATQRRPVRPVAPRPAASTPRPQSPAPEPERRVQAPATRRPRPAATAPQLATESNPAPLPQKATPAPATASRRLPTAPSIPTANRGIPVRPGSRTAPATEPELTTPVAPVVERAVAESQVRPVEQVPYERPLPAAVIEEPQDILYEANPVVESAPVVSSEFEPAPYSGYEDEPRNYGNTPVESYNPNPAFVKETPRSDYRVDNPAGLMSENESRPSIRRTRESEFYDNSPDDYSEPRASRNNDNSFYMDEADGDKKTNPRKALAKKPQGKISRKESSAARKNEKPVKKNNFAGGRKNVLIVRSVAIAVILGFTGLGVNSLVNPPAIPTKADVISVVKKDLKLTKFDPASANAFVTSFTKEYLSYVPDKTRNRDEIFKQYTSDNNLVSDFVFAGVKEGTTQTVSEGPIVTSTKALDDTSAEFDVSAKVNDKWVYLKVPVYYDEASHAFSISGTPSFTPPPLTAKTSPIPAAYENDITLATEINPYAESFFKAWGSSNQVDLSRLVDETADIETKSGLQNLFAFNQLEKLTVQKKEPGDGTDPNKRLANAKVIWSDPAKPDLKYTQFYDLKLLKKDNLWYIVDITGAVKQSGTANTNKKE